MFKDASELQSFLIWCHQQAICHVKVGEIEVRFSDIAFYDRLPGISLGEPAKTEEKSTSKSLVDTLSSEDDEELLYFSSKG